MGFLGDIFGGIPLIGQIAKGADEVFGRPGDAFNNPGRFWGDAAMGAAPFFAGPLAGAVGAGGMLPAWASGAMGMGGSMLASGSQQPGQQGGYGGGYGGGALPFFPYGSFGNMNPDIAALLSGPYGQKMMWGNPTDNLGPGYGKMMGTGDTMTDAGKNLLYQGGSLPDWNNMGALGGERNVMNEQARMSGLSSPFGDFTTHTDPYSLDPATQEAYNAQAEQINQSRDQGISSLRNQLMSEGITDPRTLASFEAQIHAGHDQILNETHAGLMQHSYNNRMNTLGGFQSGLGNLYNAQSGRQGQLLGYGNDLLRGGGGFYGQGAGQNFMANTERDSSLGALLGLGLGGRGGHPFGPMYGTTGYGQGNGTPSLSSLLPNGGGQFPWDSGYQGEPENGGYGTGFGNGFGGSNPLTLGNDYGYGGGFGNGFGGFGGFGGGMGGGIGGPGGIDNSQLGDLLPY